MDKGSLQLPVTTPLLARTAVAWTVIADLGGSYTVKMPADAWTAVPDHPRSRDSARHVRKPQWSILRSAKGAVLESLRWVAAAELAGQVWKVDGHARAMLWANEGLPRPEAVFAKVFRCQSREELFALYSTFDHPDAAETMFDRISGAYRQHELTLKSERLKNGTIASALSIALYGSARPVESDNHEDDLDIYDVVGLFAPELRLLDTVDPQNDVFPTGVVAAALLSLSLDPHLLGYFSQLSRKKGKKRDGLMDPVAALLNSTAGVKERRGSWFKTQQEQLCASALTGAIAWQSGESHPHYWVQESLPPTDIREVAQRVSEVKRKRGEDVIPARASRD